MICKDCENFRKINNTEECGEGICVFTPSAIPMKLEAECVFNPKPYTCADCDRLGNDTACMTCLPEDSAYHNGKLCGGFMDKHEVAVYEALYDWRMRGFDHIEKLQKTLEEFNTNFKLPF